MRDDRVYLETLSRLEAVDVILRRVNDDYCDPLELRQESVLGVPGLVQAVRQGNVALANPLGAGLLQTAAVLPYLPGIARHLLGEELKLRTAETFWCGDPASLKVVLERFEGLVLKPTFPDGSTYPVLAGSLPAADREALRVRVEAAPGDWVAQEQVAASTTPTLEGEGLVPRALVLDPTNDLVPGHEHVAASYGRDFGGVTPLKGEILGGGRHEVRVSVDVEVVS